MQKQLREWLFAQEAQNIQVTGLDIWNFTVRTYYHSRFESMTTKVRESEKRRLLRRQKSCARPLLNFIRTFLQEDEELVPQIAKECTQMYAEDFQYFARKHSDVPLPNIASWSFYALVKYMSAPEILQELDLTRGVSTKLCGYEKLEFIRSCMLQRIAPVVILRVGVRLLGQGLHLEDIPALSIDELLSTGST